MRDCFGSRQQQRGQQVVLRGDAAFAKPEIYEALEERGVKYAIRIPANEVRLWLSLIAYTLGNLWRGRPLGPVLPLRVGNWSLTSLQQRLAKTGGRLIKHARYYWLLLAEGHLTRPLFASMLRRIEGLSAPAG